MKTHKLVCKYCGHTWNEALYYPESIKYSRCPCCKDTDVEHATKDVFGYNYKESNKKNGNNNPFGY